MQTSSCPSTIVEKAIPSPLNVLGILVENPLTIDGWVNFWTLLLMYMSVLCQYHMILISSFIVCSEIGACESSNFVIFKIVLDIQAPLQFHLNLIHMNGVLFIFAEMQLEF